MTDPMDHSAIAVAAPCVDCGHHKDEHGKVIDEIRLRDGDVLYIYGCRECEDDDTATHEHRADLEG